MDIEGQFGNSFHCFHYHRPKRNIRNKPAVHDIEMQHVYFVFDLGADSMQSVMLVAAFEEEFDIEMEQDKALGVQSVDGAVDFIAKLL